MEDDITGDVWERRYRFRCVVALIKKKCHQFVTVNEPLPIREVIVDFFPLVRNGSRHVYAERVIKNL
ncbi:UNVERIFIED_CONTAM: hypothetical protein PYX00_005384 [Menopon gallinae]|uniref:Uncharacterized protein n=1 Tax=Menopon gallinae TaxID=328185 RepID=A0AAW2HSQ4_9NEOP